MRSSHSVTQAEVQVCNHGSLKPGPPWAEDPPVSAPLVAGTTVTCHHAASLFCNFYFLFL